MAFRDGVARAIIPAVRARGGGIAARHAMTEGRGGVSEAGVETRKRDGCVSVLFARRK